MSAKFEAFVWYYDLEEDEVCCDHLECNSQEELNREFDKICRKNDIDEFLGFENVNPDIVSNIEENQAFVISGKVRQPEIIRRDIEIRW